MTLLKALILTLAPPVLGLASYYRSLHAYSLEELFIIISRQLIYVNFMWLLISFILNVWVLEKLGAKPIQESGAILVEGDPKNTTGPIPVNPNSLFDV